MHVMLVPTMYIKNGFYNVLVVITNIICHVNNTCFHALLISNHLFLQLEAILLFKNKQVGYYVLCPMHKRGLKFGPIHRGQNGISTRGHLRVKNLAPFLGPKWPQKIYSKTTSLIDQKLNFQLLFSSML